MSNLSCFYSRILLHNFLLFTSILALLLAYGFQILGHIMPCRLCIYQRYVYWCLIVNSLIALLILFRKFYTKNSCNIMNRRLDKSLDQKRDGVSAVIKDLDYQEKGIEEGSMNISCGQDKGFGSKKEEGPLFCIGALHGLILYILPIFILFVGCMISLFHFGVEQDWWKYNSSCVFDMSKTFSSFEDYLANLKSAPLAACNIAQFYFWGISLAGWNVMYSFLIFIVFIVMLSKIYIQFLRTR